MGEGDRKRWGKASGKIRRMAISWLKERGVRMPQGGAWSNEFIAYETATVRDEGDALKAFGVRAYLVRVYLDDPSFVPPPPLPKKKWVYTGPKLPKKNGKMKRSKPGSVPAVPLPSFYDSEEWRRVRYQALRICGARCCCCGRTRHDGVVLHVDHIKPRSLYPELELELSNLQVLCEDCNLGKSNTDSIDWRVPMPEARE